MQKLRATISRTNQYQALLPFLFFVRARGEPGSEATHDSHKHARFTCIIMSLQLTPQILTSHRLIPVPSHLHSFILLTPLHNTHPHITQPNRVEDQFLGENALLVDLDSLGALPQPKKAGPSPSNPFGASTSTSSVTQTLLMLTSLLHQHYTNWQLPTKVITLQVSICACGSPGSKD